MRFLVALMLFWTAAAEAIAPCVPTVSELVEESFPENLPRTLGIEVEGSIPADRTYAGAQAELFEYLKSIPGVTDVKMTTGYRRLFQRLEPADLREYRISYKFEGRDYEMSLGLDASVNAPVGRRAMEVRSPILHTQKDMGIFLGALERLKGKVGMEATPLTGGVHVHVGAKDLGAPEVKTATRVYRRVQKGVNEFFGKTEGREPNTQDLAEKLVKLVEAGQGEPTLKELIRASRDRFRGFNLESLKRFGTLEFRVFNSTVDPVQLVFMADFAMKFVDGIAKKDPAIYRALEKPLDDPATLPALMEALGMKASGKQLEILAKIVKEQEAAQAQKYPWLTGRQRYGVRQAALSAGILLSALVGGFALQDEDDPPPTNSTQRKPAPLPKPPMTAPN